MAQVNKRKVISVFGLAGSGKNVWTRRYLAGKNRVIIVDNGEGEDDFEGIHFETFWEFHAYMKENQDGLFRVRFCPTVAEFPFVVRWAREARDCELVLDEAWRFLSPSHVPEEWNVLVAGGRHRGVNMVVISPSLSQIHIDVRRQSTGMIIFSTTEPADVDYLKKVIGNEWGDKVMMLQDLHGVEWVRGVGCSEFTLSLPSENHVPPPQP